MFAHDEARHELRRDVLVYPDVRAFLARAPPALNQDSPAALIHLRRGADEVRLFTMLTTIGTPLDVTAQDLTLESFFKGDDETAQGFRALAD